MALATAPRKQDRPRGRRTAQEPSQRAPEPLVPFTLAHFRAWAGELTLDTGSPWILEPFQEAFIEDVFAGTPECWLVIPEGNGKTTLVAGLALYHCEFRPMANVPVAASSRDQAEIMYRQAEGFVIRSPRLHALVFSPIQQAKGKVKTDVPRFLCLEGYRRIVHHAGGRIQIMAADDRTGDGGIPTLAITDELHRHRDLSLYRTWAGKLLKRQGQIVAISTSGAPGSEFETTREAIRKAAKTIRVGSSLIARTPRVALREWSLPPDAQPDDFHAVKATNPFSGITIPMLKEKYGSPTMTMEHWLRYVCNRPSRGQNTAITEVEWARARTTDTIPQGEPVAVGLDVAWKYDTTAIVPLWVRDREYRLFGPAHVLVPPRDGTMLDGTKVEVELAKVHEQNPIHTVVMDMSQAETLARWIESELGATVVDRTQSNKWAAEDFARFMDALRNGWLKHSGDADFTAHALNAIARMLPFGDSRFDRPAANRDSPEQVLRVVDALTAAAMVHSHVIASLDAPPKAVDRSVRSWS